MLVVVDTAVLAAASQWKFLFVSCLFAFESIFALGVPAFSLMRPWSGCGAVHLIEITCAERFCVVPHLEGEGEGSVEAVCFCVNHTGGAVESFFSYPMGNFCLLGMVEWGAYGNIARGVSLYLLSR